MRRIGWMIVGGFVALVSVAGLAAQPYSAQIQAALRSFVASNQTITGTWTFSTPCVGCGGSVPSWVSDTTGTPAATTRVLVSDGSKIVSYSALTMDGTNFVLPNMTAPSQAGLGFYAEIPDSLADGAALTPVLAGSGAGNLSNGVYSYCFTMSAYRAATHDYSGETACGTTTPTVTVVNAAANGKITVQLPYTCDEGASETVNIYRTTAGGSTHKLVVAGRGACGFQYTDNIADADLGVTAPTTNTTLALRFTLQDSGIAPVEGDGFSGVVWNLLDASGNNNFRFIGQDSQTAAGDGITVQLQAGNATGTGRPGQLILEGGADYNGHADTSGGTVLIRGGGFNADRAVTIAGSIFNVQTDALFSNGKALKGDTTNAHTLLLQGYDTDTGPAYVTFATITNGTAPSFALAPPAGGATVSVTASALATAGTTAVAVANVGPSSCGTTAATIAGNDTIGEIVVGATAGTQCRVTFTVAAAVRRDCVVTDGTTTIATRATYVDSTHTDFLGAFVAGDTLNYVCMAR